jgi:hypothetical protein
MQFHGFEISISNPVKYDIYDILFFLQIDLFETIMLAKIFCRNQRNCYKHIAKLKLDGSSCNPANPIRTLLAIEKCSSWK